MGLYLSGYTGAVGRAVLLLLLATVVSAHPGLTEAEILSRWDEAGPEERRRMGLALDRIQRARRFVEARPILIRFGDKSYTLAELFQEILEPPLAQPLAWYASGYD